MKFNPKARNIIFWTSIIILLGFGYLLIYKTKSNDFDNILFNIGISLISTAIITLLLSLGTKYLEDLKESNLIQACENCISYNFMNSNILLKKIDAIGIIDIFNERKKSYDENEKIGKWENFLKLNDSKNDNLNEINIMGINLDGIFKLAKLDDNYIGEDIKTRSDLKKYERLEILANEIENGATVNVILPDYYDSLFLRGRALTENIQVPEKRWEKRIDANIKILCRLKNVLSEEYRSRLNIYKYNNIMYYFLFQSRNILFISNYLGYSPGDECPAVVYKYNNDKKSLFFKYLNDFTEIKKKSSLVENEIELMNSIIEDEYNDKLCLYANKVIENKENNKVEVFINKEKCIAAIKKEGFEYPSVQNIRNSKIEKQYIGDILISSGIILFINNQLLLMKRSDDAPYDPSMWTTPAGRCDKDIEYTAFKEFYEEVYFLDRDKKPIFIRTKSSIIDFNSLKNIYALTLKNNKKSHTFIKDYICESEEIDWLKETECIQKIRESNSHTICEEKVAKMFYYFDEDHSTIEFRKILNINIQNIDGIIMYDGEYNRKVKLFSIDEINENNGKYVKCVEVIKNLYDLNKKTT